MTSDPPNKGALGSCPAAARDCSRESQRVVFTVNNDGLEPDSAFYPEGLTLDGLAYHGDADGKYAALAADSAVVVLRRKGSK